jgi:hypothetical protein
MTSNKCSVSAEEKQSVFNFVLRGTAPNRSGPCICDPCILRIWRPIMALVQDIDWPQKQ